MHPYMQNPERSDGVSLQIGIIIKMRPTRAYWIPQAKTLPGGRA